MSDTRPLTTSFVATHHRSPSARQDGIAAWLRNEIEWLENHDRNNYGDGALSAYKQTLVELERRNAP